jgi:hypothetical protein
VLSVPSRLLGAFGGQRSILLRALVLHGSAVDLEEDMPEAVFERPRGAVSEA